MPPQDIFELERVTVSQSGLKEETMPQTRPRPQITYRFRVAEYDFLI